MKKTLFILLTIFLSQFCLAQKITLQNEDKEKLPFAYLTIKPISNSNSIVISTDDNGMSAIPDSLSGKRAIVSIKTYEYQGFIDTFILNKDFTITLLKDFITLDPTVITAQYTDGKSSNSVHPIEIITAEKIEKMGAINLVDVLQNQLNIKLNQDAVLGSSMSLQGIGGQNIKILIDGVPVIGRLNGDIDLSQINLDNIERIEIVKGPLSVNYGSNALAGTINLITKKHNKKKYSAEANTYYETVGQYNLNAKVAYKLSKSTISISGGRNYFDGWNTTDPFIKFPKESPADTNRYQSWKPKEQYFGRIQLNYITKKLELTPFIDHYQEKITNRGYPKSPYFITAFDDFYFTNRTNTGLNGNLELNNRRRVNITLGYNYFKRIKNTYFKDLTTLESVLTGNESDQDTSIFTAITSRISFIGRKIRKLSYQIGTDINYEYSLGRRIKDREQTIGDFAGFITAEYKPLSNLVFKPGVRYSYNTDYKAPVTPSANILYKLKNIDFRASYANGFRAPSLKELYFNFVDINHNIVGNPNLIAERSHNFNGSIISRKKFKKSAINLELEAFYNKIFDLITLAQTNSNGQFSYVNINDFETAGTNLSFNYFRKNFSIKNGISYTARLNYLWETQDIAKFNYSPEFVSNAGYQFEKINASINLFYKFNGKVNSFALNSEGDIFQTEFGSYHILNATINKKLLREKLSINIGGKNLLNVTDVTAIGSGGAHSSGATNNLINWGRTYFISLKYRL